MLTLIYGYMGSGKTLLMAALANMATVNIVSNFSLKLCYEVFDSMKFIEGKYENSLILLDEGYTYIDNRLSPSLKNRFMSYMLFQSRKKNIQIIMSAQLLNTLDVRYRSLADIIIWCKGFTKKGFEYWIINTVQNRMVKLFLSLEKAKELFDTYDTNELIEQEHTPEQLIAFAPLEKKNEIVDKVVKEILETYPNQKITLYMIKDHIFSKDYPGSITNFVYNRVKLQLKEEKPIIVEEKKNEKKSHKKGKSQRNDE